MTVSELYEKISERIPESLREDWDNDGLMCAADTSNEVKRALITLDITEDIVDYAVANNFDLIVSHHPLIFRPLKSVTEDSHIARKVIKLIKNDIAVISLHTRADKVSGGVNDQLCDLIGIKNSAPFGEGFLGRVGNLDEEQPLEEFAVFLKELLDCDGVKYADACIPVERVAVVGGDGKDFVKSALEVGADTSVSGRISYNIMEEAGEMGINMIEAGHFFTEQPITAFFQSLLIHLDSKMYVEIMNSNAIKLI